MKTNRVYSDSNPADFIRLFVLVRTDIPYEHQAVQAGHAGIKYVMNNTLTIPFNRDIHDRNQKRYLCSSTLQDSTDCGLYTAYDDKYEGMEFTWSNGTLIYLGVDDEFELLKWEKKLKYWDVQYSMFCEPDWIDRDVNTAIACMGFKFDFNELPLLKMPKGFFANKCKSEQLKIE